jgi:hypothetical protein
MSESGVKPEGLISEEMMTVFVCVGVSARMSESGVKLEGLISEEMMTAFVCVCVSAGTMSELRRSLNHQIRVC